MQKSWPWRRPRRGGVGESTICTGRSARPGTVLPLAWSCSSPATRRNRASSSLPVTPYTVLSGNRPVSCFPSSTLFNRPRPPRPRDPTRRRRPPLPRDTHSVPHGAGQDSAGQGHAGTVNRHLPRRQTVKTAPPKATPATQGCNQETAPASPRKDAPPTKGYGQPSWTMPSEPAAVTAPGAMVVPAAPPATMITV